LTVTVAFYVLIHTVVHCLMTSKHETSVTLSILKRSFGEKQVRPISDIWPSHIATNSQSS